MSGKARSTAGEHGPAIAEGLLTALSWVTIIPIKGAEAFDRTTGRRAMTALPATGIAFGFVGAAAYGLSLLPANWNHIPHSAGFPPTALVAGVLVVTAWALLSRFMHLDGLADVGDALGSYAKPAKAQEILADKYTGAFGVAAVALTLLAQVLAVATLAWRFEASTVYMILLFTPIAARTAAQIACTDLFRPQKDEGFGAMTIGTLRPLTPALWLVVIVLLSLTEVMRGMSLAFPLAMIAAVLVAVPWCRYLSRRFDGLNGDCIGATIELSTALIVLIAALG